MAKNCFDRLNCSSTFTISQLFVNCEFFYTLLMIRQRYIINGRSKQYFILLPRQSTNSFQIQSVTDLRLTDGPIVSNPMKIEKPTRL